MLTTGTQLDSQRAHYTDTAWALGDGRPSPAQEHIELYATDWQAGIRLLKDDLDGLGTIRPETWQRFADEELSFVAEALPLRQETTFTLPVHGGQIRAADGQPYLAMLANDVRNREAQSRIDSRYRVQLERSLFELQRGELMTRMARHELGGTNVLVTFSPFAEEMADTYGTSFVSSLGYQPERRLGFVWIDALNEDGDLEQTVVSLDNGTLADFQAVLDSLDPGRGPVSTTQQMVGEHVQLSLGSKLELAQLKNFIIACFDESVGRRLGTPVRAGRQEHDVEAWSFIHSHPDVLQWFYAEAERIARSMYDESQRRQAAARLKQSLYATLLRRYREPYGTGRVFESVSREASSAFEQARESHETMVGCGGQLSFESLTPNDSVSAMAVTGKELWQWRKGFCRAPQCPSLPKSTEVGPCDVCRSCQKLFDSGADIKDVARENRRQREHRQQVDSIVAYLSYVLFGSKKDSQLPVDQVLREQKIS